MRLKGILAISVIISAFSAFCDKLDDFAESFEFIVKNCRVVESLASDAQYRKEFELRMFRLNNDAALISKTAIEIGIREISLGIDTKTFLDTIQVRAKSKIQQELYDIRRFAAADIRKQINYLKDLQFSVEDRTFVPSQYYMDDLNVQIRFSRRWKRCQEIAFAKQAFSPFVVKEYRKRYFAEIERLAKLIEEKVNKDNIEISREFQLVTHVINFSRNWDMNMDYLKGNYRYGNRIRMTPEYASKIAEMKLIAENIDKDMDLLAATEFRLLLPDSRFIIRKQKEEEKKQKAAEALEKKNNRQKKLAKTETLTLEQLEKLYQQKKDEVYNSESGINGFTRKHYDNFKGLLPESQQKEMEDLRAKYFKESYPAALARSMAAKDIYTKYQGEDHGCNESEIRAILKISQEVEK